MKAQGRPVVAITSAYDVMRDAVMARCENVKDTGPRALIARCPAHDDHSSSFGVKEGDEGAVMFHCFAGCTPIDVLESLGLAWGDILPDKPLDPVKGRKATKYSLTPTEALLISQHEVAVLGVFIREMSEANLIPEAHLETVGRALKNLRTAYSYSNELMTIIAPAKRMDRLDGVLEKMK